MPETLSGAQGPLELNPTGGGILDQCNPGARKISQEVSSYANDLFTQDVYNYYGLAKTPSTSRLLSIIAQEEKKDNLASIASAPSRGPQYQIQSYLFGYV